MYHYCWIKTKKEVTFYTLEEENEETLSLRLK